MENKKTLIILMVVAFSLVAFLGGYLISQSGFSGGSAFSGNLLQKFEGQTQVTTSSSTLLQNPLVLGSHQAVAPVNSKDSSAVIYYEKSTGRVFQVDLATGEEKLISPNPLPNFLNTIWAPDGKQVVSEFYSPQSDRFKYYNYNTRKTALLPDGVRSVAFSPGSTQIVYFQNFNSPGIFISQPDGSSFKKFLETRSKDIQLEWPQNDLIAFKVENESDKSWGLMTLTEEGVLSKIIDSAVDLEDRFSPDGTRVLFSYADEMGDTGLTIKDLKTGNGADLPFLTSAEKCAWSLDNKTVFCAVPAQSNSGNEEFYKIDTDKMTQEKIKTDASVQVDVKQIFLSNLENYLVFLNGIDGRLYKVSLAAGN